jgi:plasmid stability protein
MATLIVRKLDDDLIDRLKRRAAARGRSAEAEHRCILEEALKPRLTGAELVERLRRGPLLTDAEADGIDAVRHEANRADRTPDFDD